MKYRKYKVKVLPEASRAGTPFIDQGFDEKLYFAGFINI
jgi:hypothetical protein